jgi:hypothetical protein
LEYPAYLRSERQREPAVGLCHGQRGVRGRLRDGPQRRRHQHRAGYRERQSPCAEHWSQRIPIHHHYNIFGWHEGGDPATGFDTTAYLAAYADVAAANVNPLGHYLAFGIYEGRSTFGDGVWG